ncbi:hypothetical protein EYV94_21290 [Puteibacter caeruleilacunae]|nr:hypothetical protein EYV94_21290 [Puteibacter caeruleilacunae]
MKNLNSLKLIPLILLSCASIFTSCKDDDDNVPEEPLKVELLKGKYFVCEGDPGKSNGRIEWMNKDFSRRNPDIYKEANNEVLGGRIMSFKVVDTLGFIVLNNPSKVEVVHMRDFTHVHTIKNLGHPNDVVSAGGDKVYISNGNGVHEKDTIYVFDYKSMNIVKEIPVGKGPGRMSYNYGAVFVANHGGVEINDIVTILDCEKDENEGTIEVYEQPIDVVVYRNSLWVLCKGTPVYSEESEVTYKGAALTRISLVGNHNDYPTVIPIKGFHTNATNLLEHGYGSVYCAANILCCYNAYNGEYEDGIAVGAFYGVAIGSGPEPEHYVSNVETGRVDVYRYLDTEKEEKLTIDVGPFVNSVVFVYADFEEGANSDNSCGYYNEYGGYGY